MGLTKLIVRGARQNNLKNISLEIPRNSLTVITGLSGSGKSSLAFDTIYAEGQRRYVESLSAYARQFLDQMERPDVDVIEGLSPSIAIEQKTTTRSPRSTVGTITEIYDYLRVVYASVGVPHCPNCGKPIKRQSSEAIVQAILAGDLSKADDRVMILAPIVRGRKGAYRKELEKLVDAPFADPSTPDGQGTWTGFNRGNVLMMLQNAGNKSNWNVLARGYGADPEALFKWLQKNVTREDVQRAQGIGNIFKGLIAKSDKVYERLTGATVEKIPLQPITFSLADGTTMDVPGWYHPLDRDPRRSRPIHWSPRSCVPTSPCTTGSAG